jgi:hypothetical protein
MSELNQIAKNTQRIIAYRRAAAALSAVTLMALLVCLTLTVRTDASGQLTITISNTGISPTSATVSGGIIHLKVENSSSRNTLTLRISRENGSLVREVVLNEGVRELSTELEIGAGQYVVTDASISTWSCALTIQ